MKSKPEKMLQLKDLPEYFMDEAGHTLADYSVAIGRADNGKAKNFRPAGSGVLVRKGNRYGILTANHCIHKPGPELSLGPFGKDTLFLILRRGTGVVVPPQAVFDHFLVQWKSEAFGPDLAFIEFVSGSLLGTIKAIGSFWSLDKDVEKIRRHYGKVGTVFAVIGFPSDHYRTKIVGNTIHHLVKHMTYYYVIHSDSMYERNGWDYVEANCWYGKNNQLPKTFRGVSGGPLWAMKIERNEKSGRLTLKNFALIGIAFLETPLKKKERRLRGHSVKSIYEVMWKNAAFTSQ